MRKNRMTYYEEKETKKIFIISFSVLIVALLVFVTSYTIYSNILNASDVKLADRNKTSITDLTEIAAPDIYEASTSIGKKVNELVIEQEEDNDSKNESESIRKIAINTSKMLNENDEKENDTKETVKNETIKIDEEIKIPDPTFDFPVEGNIIVDYAKDKLVYSNTLGEWVTHNGIDIKADKATIVKAASEGTIKSIKTDPRYGITVVIEHVNGFETMYANLCTAEFIKEGEKVKKGQTIGTVGNTAAFEIADEPHLHFEILKDGDNLDPNIYL